MDGFDPSIHVLSFQLSSNHVFPLLNLDGRIKSGHDGDRAFPAESNRIAQSA
jgi:hypothetical protein